MIVGRSSFEDVLGKLKLCQVLALDTETFGLRTFHGDRFFSLIISTKEDDFYFNFHIYPNVDYDQSLGTTQLKALKEHLFTNENIYWYVHNAANFDLGVLGIEGFELVGTVHCTKAIARIQYNDYFDYDLASCLDRLGLKKDDKVAEYIEDNKLFEVLSVPGKSKKIKRKHFDKVPFEIIVPYGETDARGCFSLGEHQREEIAKMDAREPALQEVGKTLQRVVDNENRLVKTIHRMRMRGVLIDRDYCERAAEFEKSRGDNSKQVFRSITGNDYCDSGKLFAQVFGDQKDSWSYTKKGNPSFDADALARLSGPTVQTVLEIRDAKSKQDFYNGFLYHADKESVVHPCYNQDGTRHGRLCVAKGTLIEIVRDVSKHPKGIPIEKVKVGDYAYTYGDDLNLTLRKVTWAGKTGRKKVLRIYWAGTGGHTKGYLDLTPEHRVRLTDGSYKAASSLVKGDKILSMSRSITCGYGRLHTRNTEIREHRFIFEKVHGRTSEHVHHIDGNKLNNTLSNLEGMSVSEHTSVHAKELMNTPEAMARNKAIALKNWGAGKFKSIPFGASNPNYVGVTRFAMLKALASVDGYPTKISGFLNDFNTVKQKCADLNIDIKKVQFRYGKNGFVSRGLLLESFSIPDQRERLIFVGVGYAKFHALCKHYGVKYSNHWVSKIEYLDTPCDVYDLEIEETHNFIANDLCLHNSSSSPNFQNLSNTEESKKEEFSVRGAIIPRPGFTLCSIDYNAMEYRFAFEWACRLVEHETDLVRLVKSGLDPHEATAANTKEKANLVITRGAAKTVNFLTLYGGGEEKLALGLKCSIEQASKIKQAIFKGAPEIGMLLDNIRKTAKVRGFIVNWFGRRCHFPVSSTSYKAPNYFISGGCADVVKIAMNQVDELLLSTRSKLIMTVHDELIFEIADGEEFLVEKLKGIMETVFQAKYLPLTCSASSGARNLSLV